MLIPLFLSTLGCNTVGFDAVSINPIYGFVDGCNDITVSGHGFGEKVGASIGDNPITNVEQPSEDTETPAATEKGFMFSGWVPPATDGATGLHDVTVVNESEDGTVQTDTITGSGGYYYVACPAPGLISSVGPGTGVSVGAEITVIGCNLGGLYAEVIDLEDVPVAAPIPLTASECGSGRSTFSAPSVPADTTYYVRVTDADGNVYSGATATSCENVDTAVYIPPGVDSSIYRDTAYVGGAYGCYSLTYGGAQ